MTSLGTSLRTLRDSKGLSLQELRDELLFTIPRRFVPSVATLSRIETGKIRDKKVDTIIVYGLAKVLACKVSDLSTDAGEEFDAIADLVEQSSRCIAARDESEGQGRLDFAAAQ